MSAITTLNATVEQIESMLHAGSTVQEVAEFYSEPARNVFAVQRAMNGSAPTHPDLTKARQVPVGSPQTRPSASATPPSPPVTPVAGPSVDALVAAAQRSGSKRTQALGSKLEDLSKLLRQRLTDERETAERSDREREERERAAAEVERLEAQLREARAKLRPPRRRGGVRLNAAA